MLKAAFIGDEVTAAGYRLAGLSVLTGAAAESAESFRKALRDADLVLVGASAAAAIPERELSRAQASARPLVVVVPDMSGEEPADFGTAVNRAFGLEL